MSTIRRRDASVRDREMPPSGAQPIDGDDDEPREPDDLQSAPSDPQPLPGDSAEAEEQELQEQPQSHEEPQLEEHDEADQAASLEADVLSLEDPAADSSASLLAPPDSDAAAAASSTSPRVLYEVLFHAPHFQPDLGDSLDDGLLSSSPLADAAGSPTDFDDVSEIEYLAHMERRAAAASSVQHAAREQIHRVWWNCCKRRSAAVREKEKDDENTADAAAAAATAATADPSSDSAASSSPSALSNWPVVLSPNGDLLAIIRERSVVLRGSNHDFAGAQMELPLAPYVHAQSPYPTSIAGMLAATVPKAAQAPGWTHPFSASHARPFAWSLRSELIAVVARHDEVAVYALTPLRLVHTLRVDARSPLESPPSSSALSALPIAASRGAAAQFPAIAALVFREAPCPLTPRGYCPHLIVLCADGSVQHLHIPAVSMHSEGAATAPSSPYLSSNQGASAAQQTQPLSTFYPPHLPLAHTGRSSPDDSGSSTPMRASPTGEQQLRQRGVPPSRSLAAAADAAATAEVDAHASASASAASASASSREYLTFPGVAALHARIGGAPNVFGACSFDPQSQRLFLASISAGRDRTPQVSVWRVSDTESPFLFPLSISPSVAVAPSRPVLQRPGTLRRLLTFARISVGATEIGGADDPAQPKEEDEYRSTLADVASSLRLSPDGSRVALLDQRGNLNIWIISDHADDERSSALSSSPQWTLLDSHRWRDGCPSLPSGGGGDAEISPVLLCDVTWWSADLLLCAYTNGHLVLTPVNSPAMLSARAAASANPAFSAPSMHALHLSSGESLRRNLLGDRPEGVHGIPTLTRAIEARMQQQQLVTASSARRSAESLSGSPVLGPMSAPSSSAVSTLGSVVSLPHRVFLLECERRFLRRRKLWSSVGATEDESTNSGDGAQPSSSSADEGDDDPPIVLRRTFRLLSLCESTPEQFLLSKVEARQYDEALGLARAYRLNTDLIFQARWRNAAVSAESVRSLLLPITDRWWVLAQLVDRLFEVDGDLDAAGVLLQCGLECTTPECISEIRLRHEREAADSGREYSVEGFEREQTKLCMYRLLFLHYSDRVHTLLTIHRCAAPSLSLSRLTYDSFLECDLVSAALSLARDSQFLPLHLLFYFHQAELWSSRRQILAAIPDTADPRDYAEIMPMPGMSFAQFTQMAEGGAGDAEQQIDTDADTAVESAAAAPAAAAGANFLSSHFDPTHPAHPSNRAGRRDRDWIENIELLQTMLQLCRQSAAADPSFPASMPFDFESLEAKLDCISLLEDASCVDLTSEEVARFYTDRVAHMDSSSGRLNFAARLLDHAVDRLGVQGLDSTRCMLSDLTTLVYTYELDFLSLKDYAPLSDFDRLCLVMRGATPNSIEADLRTKANMFFERSEHSSNGGQQATEDQAQESEDPFELSPLTPALLRRYLIHIAPSRLDLIYAVVLASSPRRQQQQQSQSGGSAAASSASSSSLPPPLLRTHADLVSVALECCYFSFSANDPSPPDASTLQLLSSIFECLPARSHSDSPRLSLLHRYLDELDNQLTALEILAKYGHARPLQFFLTLPDSHEPGTQVLQRWGPHRAAREAQRIAERKWASKHPSLKRSAAPPLRAETECLRLLESMVRSLLKHQKQSSSLSDEAWHALLRDLLELRLKVFPFLTPEQVHALVLHGTLSRERWALSRDLLRSVTSANALLGESALMSLPAAERLVLDVAKEFLNAAPSLRSHGLAQAEACLELLPIQEPARQQLMRGESTDSVDSLASDASRSGAPASLGLNQLSSPALTAEWQSEFELLAGLRQLEKMGVDAIVPLEIRLAKDRQTKDMQQQTTAAHDGGAASSLTVLDLLLRAKPRLYMQGSHLLEVLRSLGYASDSAQVAAHLQLASAALHHGDYRSSLKSVLQLMEHSPPTIAAQREQAAELCAALSEYLAGAGGVAPPSSTGGGGSTGLLAKPKLHLLAHSMWACDDAQQLNAFLHQYMAVQQQQQAATAIQAKPQTEPRESKEEKQQTVEDDVFSEKQQVALLAPAASSLSAASVWEDDGDGTAQSEMEQLIASAFGAGSDTQTQARRARPDLLAITQQAAATSTETESATTAPSNEATSAVASVSSVDAALLQLIDGACGVDSPLALSYLLSLSSPLAAAPLLAAKLDDASAGASAGASALPAFVSSSPLLSRSQRLETVDVALRFFALTAIMQPHTPQIVAAMQEHAASQAAARAKAAAAAGPTSPSADFSPRGWGIPSASTLLDCSLETLQGYLDLLHVAYDSAASFAPAPRALSLAMHYSSVRAESAKSEFILQHCPNLDTVRFSSDAAYRIDSIRSMAAGNKQEDEALGNDTGAAAPLLSSRDTSDSSSLSSARMLELALLLCKRYHLPAWDVYMERTRALFVRVRSVQRLRAEIDGLKVQLMSNPIATYTALIQSVWPALRGSDLPRLSFLLDLCVDCFGAILHAFQSSSSAFVTPGKKRGLVLYERNLARIQEHKELLDKLAGIQNVTQQQQQQTSSSPSTPPRHSASLSSSSLDSPTSPLDYKLLISSPASCMCELRKLLTEHNIFLVTRLTAKIQAMLARSEVEKNAEAEAAATAAEDNAPATAAPLINGGLFPVLKQNSQGSCANLSDVLWDVPPVAATAASAAAPSDADSSSAATAVRIDSSLLFMLFLSHSLRRHLDALVAASSSSGPPSAALTALPTVSAWFARFDSLLKRLTVPHLAQLVSDLVLAGSRPEQPPVVGFTVRPHKVELRNRLEIVQCALRILEQLPAWNGAAASAAAPPPPGMLRSPSIDLDSSSPPLSSESKARIFDDLTEANMFLCILCAIFEMGSLAGSAELWSTLVHTRGDSTQLLSLMLRVLESVASPSSSLHPRDCVRMLDKIRVQKDSFTEWRSARRIQAQVAEEETFVWKLFPILRGAVENKIKATSMQFGALEEKSTLATLLDASALTQLVSAPACDLPALLSAFSSDLSEEQNIELFQMILQFITGSPSEAELERGSAASLVARRELQLQYVRAQLRVIMQLDRMADQQASSSMVIASPSLHSTLREQLVGSAPLRQQLKQSLHVQLILLQCDLAHDALAGAGQQQDNAAESSSSSSSSSAPDLSDLASQFVSAGRRADALSSSLHRWSDIATLPTALAAIMLLSAASDRRSNKKDAAASLASWSAFVDALIERDEFELLMTVLRTPFSDDKDASSSASLAASRVLWGVLDESACLRFYRSLLTRSVATPAAELAAYKFALSCPAPSSSLPLQAVQHLVQRSKMQSSTPLQLDDNLQSLLLSRASLSLLLLLPCAALFTPLARRLVSDYQRASPESRRSQVGEGSLPHALALLVSDQLYAQAVALFAQAQSGSGSSSSSGGWMINAHRTHMASIKSMMQQAKSTLQQRRDESDDHTEAAAIDAALQLYRQSLYTMAMDEMAS